MTSKRKLFIQKAYHHLDVIFFAMPKSSFKKRHVKFASEDVGEVDAVVHQSEKKHSNGERGESVVPSQNQIKMSQNDSGTGERKSFGRPPHFRMAEIEIVVEDEEGVTQYHHHHDGTTQDCSGCHMLGHSAKHHRLGTDDGQSDDSDDESCGHNPKQGPHVVFMTVLCIPFVFVIALVVAGYLGVLTWYNIFLYYYDERGWIHRIVVCPLLILSFPPIILSAALGISLYSALNQLSWYMSSWRTSVTDMEKGFYAWLCLRIGLQECAPYEVITLDDDEEDRFGRTVSHAVSSM